MRTCVEYLTVAQIEETAEHRPQTYHSLVLRGKLRTAVKWITERETGGVLQLRDQQLHHPVPRLCALVP